MIKGVVAGNFDVIHPGYIEMFKECSKYCTQLIVFLHSDPSIERPEKLKPILSVEERKEILLSIKYIDDVYSYTYEESLYELLKLGSFGIRFLGEDYVGKPYTGDVLKIPIHWLDRGHGWSTTKYKKLIAESYEKSNNS